MKKFIYSFCILIFTHTLNVCLALDLELSDVIKEARQQQKLQQSNIQQVKQEIKQADTTEQISGEQSACEKINPDEILSQEKQ